MSTEDFLYQRVQSWALNFKRVHNGNHLDLLYHIHKRTTYAYIFWYLEAIYLIRDTNCNICKFKFWITCTTNFWEFYINKNSLWFRTLWTSFWKKKSPMAEKNSSMHARAKLPPLWLSSWSPIRRVSQPSLSWLGLLLPNQPNSA